MPSSIISTINSIWKKMRRKPYRDAFIASHVSETVAAQIVLLRSARGWTQKQLAEKTSMKQSRISALEDPNYENYEVGTLKRIASAFDVGLTVRFVPFSDVVRWSATLGPHKLTIADFENDCIRLGALNVIIQHSPSPPGPSPNRAKQHYRNADDDEHRSERNVDPKSHFISPLTLFAQVSQTSA